MVGWYRVAPGDIGGVGKALFLFFFWETTILFSIAIAPFYIPTAGHKGFKFLHVLTDTCYFLGFFFIVAILKGDFYLHFPNA